MSIQNFYLPALEPLLKGETTLLPWALVGSALSDTSGKRQECALLLEFLNDAYVQTLFAEPSKTFAPSSQQSKSVFENLTSPIQIAPTPNGRYDVKQIKEDTKWLSETVTINEETALRIILVEFQSRAQNQLRGPLSTQDVVNLQDAAGLTNSQASSIFPSLNFTNTMDADSLWSEFDEPKSRKRRLLETYFTERRYFMMSADYVLSKKLRGRLPTAPIAISSSNGSQQQQVALPGGPDKQMYQDMLLKYLQLLEETLESAALPLESTIQEAEFVTAELEQEWTKSHLAVAVHALGVIFQVLDMKECNFAPISIIDKWFEFVGHFGFLDGLQAVNEEIGELIAPLRCLVSVTTLKVLNLPEALAYLLGESTSEDDEDPYVTDSQLLEKIHQVIMDASEAGSITASPAIFAWTILTHLMFSSHQSRVEKRDSTQQMRAVTNFEQNMDLEMQPRPGRRNSDASMVSMEAAAYDNFLSSVGMHLDFQIMEQTAASVIGKGEIFYMVSEMSSGLGDSLAAMFPPGIGSRMRIVLIKFIGCTHPFVQYQEEPVSALLATLSGNRSYWDLLRANELDADADVLAQSLQDPSFLDPYFFQSLNRYPLEFMPFIEFSRALSGCLTLPEESKEAGLIPKLLSATPTLTFVLPSEFQQYELTSDGDNSNAFVLLDDLNLFPENTIAWGRGSAGTTPFVIPASTRGRFITDSGHIVQLDYTHSALSLLGKRLEASLYGRQYQPVLGDLETDQIAASISLMATLLQTGIQNASRRGNNAPWEDGTDLLEEFGAALTRNKDITTIICEVLDHYLQEELADPDSNVMAILTACVQFLHAILPIVPGRVWSYMTRCALLNTESSAGRLSRITANLDMVFDRFDFLVSSMLLMFDMVESAMTSSVQRKAGVQLKGRVENLWAGTSDKLLARVCFSVAQTTVDIFENSSTWRFSSELHRTVLMRNVVPILNRIVKYAFILGDSKPPGVLTACLFPAASYIVDSFLTPSAGSLRFQPLLTTFIVSFQLQEATLYPRRKEAYTDRLISCLEFATTLVRVANVMEKPQTIVEAQLFKSASLLARVCAVNSTFRRHSLELLEALVLSAASGSGEPPSLLGYLSAQATRSFLALLSTLDKPFNQTIEVNRIWRFFSAIVRNRQQWMANCLLTGKMPRDSIRKSGDVNKGRKDESKKEEKTETSPTSVLKIGADRLAKINEIPASESLVILEFLTSALNYYPWTIFTVHKQGELLDGLRQYMHFLPPSLSTAKANITRAIHQARIGAHLAEFFAMLIYHLRQIGDADELAEHVMQDLDYCLREGVAVSGYNTSLHVNLGRNFEKQYAGCKLEDFKRTLLEPRELGSEFFYALDYADTMLKFDPGWVGKKNNGFKSELERANNNLSLVDAQVALFHSWEFLLVELTNCLRKNEQLPTKMMQVARQCLDANEATHGPERFFQQVSQSRANLCLLLIQRLAGKAPKFAELTALLQTVWSSISATSAPFTAGDPNYYRTLLKILFVTLRAYSHYNSEETINIQAVRIEQAILNIIDKVVGQNFRTLVTLVHDPEVESDPSDIALLTAILQACLSMPGMDENQTQILNILSSHDALHVAIALYSWSDKLALSESKRATTSVNGVAGESDPIYGELSLLFLRELSALPQIAETMAAEGLLSQIASASITSYIRRPTVGPLSDSLAAQRCYSIWVKGILPILVHVLKAVGATIAPEVALVLNQFPHLLAQSVQRLEPPAKTRISSSARGGKADSGYVTLLALSELQHIALLNGELTALRVAQPGLIPEIKWDSRTAEENLDLWLNGSRRLLRERIVALGTREVEWRSQRLNAEDQRRMDCDNRLEQRVVAALVESRAVIGMGDRVDGNDGGA
ncbi:hypothetical protein MKZ38_008282 [Zalerion maritima]|uniref:Nucleoporin NUP188 n=1 Tax=Zalerion maritima TaxID=339359 RepID=A0AAD5RI43_9PEZI|nr:hypothetical protein MKZ38_008282 [Zalerion maritima]